MTRNGRAKLAEVNVRGDLGEFNVFYSVKVTLPFGQGAHLVHGAHLVGATVLGYSTPLL